MADKRGFDRHAALIEPLKGTGAGFTVTLGVLGALVALAGAAYAWQLIHGVGVTGLNRPVFWGLYIINWIYFIGLSYGVTMVSATLRLLNSRWWRALRRPAEVMTICALGVGAFNIVLDMGRPDRVLGLVLHGRIQSAIVWDFYSILLYMVCSLLYLYLPLIPDIAILRDRFPHRKRLYRFLALGYTGTSRQKRLLERVIDVMAVIVLLVAFVVPTAGAWLFSLTTQPMWHSTIMGPYFIMGAIFSGIGMLVVVLAILRRVFRLEGYFRQKQFSNLGLLLLVMALVWLYFTGAEYITTLYGNEPSHMAVFQAKISGEFSPIFWAQVVFCFIVPFSILVFRRGRTIAGTVVAGISINVGMWLERLLIIVPTLARPRMPIGAGHYAPTWVEIIIMVGSAAGIALLYVLFTKFFPIISIWELDQGTQVVASEQEGGPELMGVEG